MLVVILCVALLFWSAQRSRELFVLSVRNGRLMVMRGHLPQSLFDALADVMARARVRHATLSVVRVDGMARLSASGLDEFVLQRARNVLGTFPFQRLVSANWPVARNTGQRLGLAWLAFRLAGKSAGSEQKGGSLSVLDGSRSEPEAGREQP
jgi:hypothetical protein